MKNKWIKKIKESFMDSVGMIVFGMEDGTVSVFGLVFGMALSVQEHDVLLAGIAGGAAGAISMMAGAYLDAKSERSKEVMLDNELKNKKMKKYNESYIKDLQTSMNNLKASEEEVTEVTNLLEKHPNIVLALRQAGEARAARFSPWLKAIWMFVADIIAASMPVLPFFFLPIKEARIVSVILTTLMLIVLGIGRSRLTDSKPLKVIIETVGIAYLAAIGGILLSRVFNLAE